MTEPDQLRCLVVADFNISNFVALLENDQLSPSITVLLNSSSLSLAPLFAINDPIWDQSPTLAIVWARPESAFREFSGLVSGEGYSAKSLIEEVDRFCDAVLAASSKSQHLFLPCWIYPAIQRVSGMGDFKTGFGVEEALLSINQRTSARLSEQPSIHILNANRWLQMAGASSLSRKLWYMAKIPYSNEFFRASVADIKAGLNGVLGKSRKLIVTDLDDTLWGGVVGDVGWDNIRLGGHDAVDEAFVDVQRTLKSLSRRGVVLAIVSKNEESTALQAIDSNPEMILRRKDFVGWRINWQDKAENIVSLVSELKLGLDAVVYLDDNPVERARIKQALPEVLVVDLPEDKLLFPETILALSCFDSPNLTQEDLTRASLYHAEKERESLRKELPSLDEWLASLQTIVTVERLSNANIRRATQLLNKTNQMNLRTRRMSESEFLNWSQETGHLSLTFRVADVYGDAGLTGILSLSTRGDEAIVEDFVLSCRVMGRSVEEAMIAVGCQQAVAAGCQRLLLVIVPTPKNNPCKRFLDSSQLEKGGNDGEYSWDLRNPFPASPHIRIDSRG